MLKKRTTQAITLMALILVTPKIYAADPAPAAQPLPEGARPLPKGYRPLGSNYQKGKDGVDRPTAYYTDKVVMPDGVNTAPVAAGKKVALINGEYYTVPASYKKPAAGAPAATPAPTGHATATPAPTEQSRRAAALKQAENTDAVEQERRPDRGDKVQKQGEMKWDR